MISPRREFRVPPADLVEDLIVRPEPCLGDPEGLACRAMPRHLRLYVAGWMLSDGTAEGDKRALREAYQLYELSGRGLLDQARILTTADIVAEVLQLAQAAEQVLATTEAAFIQPGPAPEAA